MSRKTQRYSKEFKAEAVRTVPENQLSISEGASRLSLPEGTLGQWVTAARKGLGTPGSRTVAELESEILQLRKASLKRCVRYLVYPGAVITTGYSMNPQTENKKR
ncbi:IS600 ORF1 [Shigella sonnei]|nr:IS600 ORF1 [Shigella sonnei]SSA11509.1 IS600 ORF1 [Shigella sonnei]